MQLEPVMKFFEDNIANARIKDDDSAIFIVDYKTRFEEIVASIKERYSPNPFFVHYRIYFNNSSYELGMWDSIRIGGWIKKYKEQKLSHDLKCIDIHKEADKIQKNFKG